jgi:hypothetical protein
VLEALGSRPWQRLYGFVTVDVDQEDVAVDVETSTCLIQPAGTSSQLTFCCGSAGSIGHSH